MTTAPEVPLYPSAPGSDDRGGAGLWRIRLVTIGSLIVGAVSLALAVFVI